MKNLRNRFGVIGGGFFGRTRTLSWEEFGGELGRVSFSMLASSRLKRSKDMVSYIDGEKQQQIAMKHSR